MSWLPLSSHGSNSRNESDRDHKPVYGWDKSVGDTRSDQKVSGHFHCHNVWYPALFLWYSLTAMSLPLYEKWCQGKDELLLHEYSNVCLQKLDEMLQADLGLKTA